MVSLGTSGYLSKYDSKISASDSVVVALLNIRCPFDHKFFVYCFLAGGLRSLLFQQGVGDLGRGFAHLLEFFFRLIFDLQIVGDDIWSLAGIVPDSLKKLVSTSRRRVA